jgi:hypothetical protein
VVLAVILAACDSGSDSSNADKNGSDTTESSTTATTSGSTAENAATAPEGALAAINEYVKGQGHEYVGDCADAELPRDKAKW